MSKELDHAPAARSWRDIPQPVKARAMSSGGRRRLAVATIRTCAGMALTIVLAWGVWELADVLRERPQATASAVRAIPLRPKCKSPPQLIRTADYADYQQRKTLLNPR